MRYSVGQGLSEYGFQFLEKLHSPIFLINRLGKIIKVNEAGRKLLCIAHVSIQQIESQLQKQPGLLSWKSKDRHRFSTRAKNSPLKVIASECKGSDFILVEVQRS